MPKTLNFTPGPWYFIKSNRPKATLVFSENSFSENSSRNETLFASRRTDARVSNDLFLAMHAPEMYEVLSRIAGRGVGPLYAIDRASVADLLARISAGCPNQVNEPYPRN